MTDEEWEAFCLRQEREALEAHFESAIARLPFQERDALSEKFERHLKEGGVEAVCRLTEILEGVQFVLLYPIVIEHFLRASRSRPPLSKRELARTVRQKKKLARCLREASNAALGLDEDSYFFPLLAGQLAELEAGITQLAQDEESRWAPPNTGRRKKPGTPLAVGLDSLFRTGSVAIMERMDRIAAVVTAFIEPVSGEQLRQRVKDLSRRPPTTQPDGVSS